LLLMKRVLFVCVENSNRSQMAEAFARMAGADVEAHSAGSAPSGRINPRAVAAMKELGYALGSHSSKSLAAVDGMEFDAVVTMGCGDSCPWVPARIREDWQLPDPRDMDEAGYRVVRDEIGRRVRVLLGLL
jgi:arsenate reductase